MPTLLYLLPDGRYSRETGFMLGPEDVFAKRLHATIDLCKQGNLPEDAAAHEHKELELADVPAGQWPQVRKQLEAVGTSKKELDATEKQIFSKAKRQRSEKH